MTAVSVQMHFIQSGRLGAIYTEREKEGKCCEGEKNAHQKVEDVEIGILANWLP